jgi:hypothetical protein
VKDPASIFRKYYLLEILDFFIEDRGLFQQQEKCNFDPMLGFPIGKTGENKKI